MEIDESEVGISDARVGCSNKWNPGPKMHSFFSTVQAMKHVPSDQDNHTFDDGCRCHVRSNMPSRHCGGGFDLLCHTSYQQTMLFLSFLARPPPCSKRP